MISTRLVVFLGAVGTRPERLAAPPIPETSIAITSIAIISVPITSVPITGALPFCPLPLGTSIAEEQLDTSLHLSCIEAIYSIGSSLDGSELHETSGKQLAIFFIAHYEE